MEGLTYTKYDQEADKSQNYPGGIPVFRMICDTCCNMMLFSYKHVRNAIMDKKEPKGDDENVSTKP